MEETSKLALIYLLFNVWQIHASCKSKIHLYSAFMNTNSVMDLGFFPPFSPGLGWVKHMLFPSVPRVAEECPHQAAHPATAVQPA